MINTENINKFLEEDFLESKIRYIVIESEGFGIQEDNTEETYRKEFNTKEEALFFLSKFRKDRDKNGKPLNWNNWETRFTYKIIGKVV